MKKPTTSRRDNTACDQNSSRKGSQDTSRSTSRSRNYSLGGIRLPFVLVLTVITAIIAAGLTFSTWQSKHEGTRVADQRRKPEVTARGPKQTAQPQTSASSVGSDEIAKPDDRVSFDKKLYAPANGVTPSMASAQMSPNKARPIVDIDQDNVNDQVLTSQNSPLLRSARVPSSSAIRREARDDDDVDQERRREALEQDELTSQSQQEASGANRRPREERLTRAHSFDGDLRNLPFRRPIRMERPEREGPEMNPSFRSGASPTLEPTIPNAPTTPSAPAPPPNTSFDGLDFANWGAGHPPDTVGDVGPTYFIQAINSSIGIFRKSDGVRVAAFTLNTFMSQGSFGNLCDTNNFGDPVVLYDSFEDRWIITDFAFQLSGGNVVNPPGAFQCVAASKTGDPVSGGWNFYSINTQFGLGDYPKFGIWPDGLYMSANVFGFPSGAPFQNARAYAFNKQQMYAGTATVKVVSFDILGNGDFTVIPSNARLQSGTPPVGTPNYFVSSWLFLNALTVYKFHVDWNNISTSTFTGPDIPLSATSWPNATVPNAPSLGGNALDVLQIRAMMQNQYSNIGGAESLWATHTVRRGNTTGFAAPRWYQADVTGGAVNPNLTQATTWDPDGANVIYRFMPSLAVDRVGDMALGYSTSNSTTKPAIKYAGRLFNDPINTFSQTEQLMTQGTGTQTGNCGGSTCIRWGDYSAMSLDPDGCTFWYTNMYYAVDGLNHLTRIGSFGPFAGCTPVGAGGTLSGTVTATNGGAPIAGATLQFGSRSTTTDGSGLYSFSIPAGTYSSVNASKAGFLSSSASPIAITDGNTTTQNFSLADAPTSSCDTDTTQTDLQTGVPTGVDLTGTPGSAVLSSGDPQNTIVTTAGVGITTTTWGGQTFTPLGTGQVTKIDVSLFCSACSGTPQSLTVGIRATSGGLPTGADLATATIPGFLSGTAAYYSAVFASPPTLAGGTMYAFVIHPNVNPTGTYALIRSGADVYSGGTRVSGASSGTSWSIPLTSTQTTDTGFRVWMSEVVSAGNLVSELKDANPAAGLTPIWSTLSWNAATPPNTSVKFQVAGSNSATGPFNFVGPDGTAATFFTTSPAQLSPQFYNLRFIEYKSFLSTTDNLVTPSLDDVTICFNDVDCSGTVATITPTTAAVCESSTGNTASGPAGMTSYAWGITNGTITSAANIQSITYTAGASGTVTLNLTVTAPNGCIVSGSQPVTINPTPAQPTITPNGPTTFISGGSVTLSSSSASGNQWYLNGNLIGGATTQGYVATAAGNYTVVVTTSGCSSAPSAPTAVAICPSTATVTNTNDSGAGSLRQAITDLCSGVTINFSNTTAGGATNFFDGSPHTITLASELVISQNLTIIGPGANLLTINGSNASRVINVQAGTVTISSVSITNGKVTGSPGGAGVLNAGTLTLSNCTIADNNSQVAGGGVENNGANGSATLTISGCTISGNTASSFGSGIMNEGFQGNATLHLRNSTVTGNGNTSFGGGIYNDGNSGTATLNITNATISGNNAGSTGGGIYNFSNGGNGMVNLNNTIVSDNTGPTAANGPDIFNFAGTISGSNNDIKTTTGYTISGTNNLNVDPMLEKNGAGNLVLKNNGGPTKTLLLMVGSPVINGGNNTLASNAGLTTDQRGAGFSRFVNTTVDLGAVEVNYAIAATNGTPQSAVINAAFATALQATVKESNIVQNNIPVTFTPPASGASGTFASSSTVNTNAGGIATAPTFTANLIVGGPYNVVASLAGGSPSANFALTNTRAATNTALGSSLNPSNLAQNVTFTATVTGPAGTGTPTGAVVFKDGGSAIACTNAGGQTLNGGGVATCQTAALTAGSHTITADYGGDTNFNISTGTLSGGQTVNNRPLISLSASTYTVNEADGFIRIIVNRTGDTAPAVTVDYATDDTGASTNCAALNTTLASSRCDYETMLGTLQFAATETQKTVDIPINRDAFTEGPESFTVNLSNMTGGGTLINPSSATVTINDSASPTQNAIDDIDLFVKQQYHDFLNREPDAAGLAFWKNNIDICNQPGGAAGYSSVAQCIEVKRIITSGAFFLSIEFMQSGTFVRNSYVAALDRPATNNMPGFTEWLRDTQAVERNVIVGQGSWQATLDANRTAFLNDFVTRAEFVGLYPTTDTPTQYVDKLYLHAAVTPGSAQERTDAIAEFGVATTAADAGARGRALARILQNEAFRSREINRAFVQFEYFGYLRRNPNDPPDGNFNGYNFWLAKLNQFSGDFLASEMVKAFLGSDEYRKRFGQ